MNGIAYVGMDVHEIEIRVAADEDIRIVEESTK